MVKGLLPASANKKIEKLTMDNVFIPLVSPDEIEPKYNKAWKYITEKIGHTQKGDYLEFGVSHGSSLSCMHRVLKELKLNDVRLFGFDSFEGMPESAANEDGGEWKPGQFASPIEFTTKLLTDRGVDWSRTFLIKGWFNETLTPETVRKHSITKASVIMIDCDIYSSSKTALNFCIPFIKDLAVVFFDDWKDDKDFGEYKAFEEFLKENPQFKSEPFGDYAPTGKIFVVTNTQA